MANKNFTLNFDASMNISQIKSAISEMQRAFSGLKLSQGLNTNIQNVFSKINSELEKFEDLTSKSFHSLSDVSKASSSFERIIDYYKQLEKYGKEITGMDKEKFFPDSVVSNITKANKALQTYYRELEAIPAEIEKANKALAKQEATLDSLTQKRNALAAENKSLGSTKGGISRKITAKEAEQSNLTAQMSSLEASGIKKSSAEYKALASQYNILTQELKKLKSEAAELDSTVAKNRATIASLDSQINSTTTNISQLKQELGQMTQSLNTASLDKLRNSLAEITGEDISKIPTDIENIKKIINNIPDKELKKIKAAFDEINESVSEAKDPIDKTKQSLKDFGKTAESVEHTANEVENLKNQVLDFFSISNTIQLFRNVVQKATEAVKELDATMTEAAVVTDFSIGDMWSQLPTYSEEATKLGATINDLYGATTLYYQQGLNTNEAMNVGIETMKMARIAAMDSAEATQLMTAALRGFNMELNETSAQRVNDVYSELAAITAADTAQIGTAMSKTASIAASANMEFETTAALLAQIIETTQEAPETAGTAMKTIIARFTEVKELFTEGQLTGEDSEGEAIDINKIDTALKTVGISLTDFLTGARGLDDILLELASKWDSLDIATQRYIATTAAGSRQQSRFLAMMSDYDRTMELVEAANDSAGSSQKQFEKTMESLESKLNVLANAWNEFTMGIANNQVIKTIIDLLSQFITTINNLTDSLGDGISGFLKLSLFIGGLSIGKTLFNNIFGFIKKEFSSLGTESGKIFSVNFTKSLKGIRGSISKEGREYANLLTTIYAEELKKEKISSTLLKQMFDDSKGSTELAKNIKGLVSGITDGAMKAIDFSNLNSEGQRLADKFLSSFASEVRNSGKVNEAIATLENQLKSIDWKKFGATNITLEDTGSFDMASKSISKLKISLGQLGTVAIATGLALGAIAEQLESSGYDEAASSIRAMGTAMSTFGMVTDTVSGIVAMAGKSIQGAWGPIITIISAAIGIITAYFSSQSESIKKAKEELRELIDQAKELGETTKEEGEAFSQYENLYITYQQTKEGKEDLIEVTKELAEAYNIELSTLDLLGNSYDKIYKKMLKVREAALAKDYFEMKEGFNKAEDIFLQQGTLPVQVGGMKLPIGSGRISFSTLLGKSDVDIQITEELKEAFRQDSELLKFLVGSSDSFALSGIKNGEDLSKVINAIEDVVYTISNDSEYDSDELEKSVMMQMLKSFLETAGESYNDYNSLYGYMEDSTMEAAKIQTQLTALEDQFKIEEIDSLDKFRNFKLDYVDQATQFFNERGIEKTEEEINILVNNALSEIDSLSDYAAAASVLDEIKSEWKITFDENQTEKDFDNLVLQLQKEGKLDILANVVFPEGVSSGEIQKYVQIASDEMDAALAQQRTTSINPVLNSLLESGNLSDLDEEQLSSFSEALEMISGINNELITAKEEWDNISQNQGTFEQIQYLTDLQQREAALAQQSAENSQKALQDQITIKQTTLETLQAQKEAMEQEENFNPESEEYQKIEDDIYNASRALDDLKTKLETTDWSFELLITGTENILSIKNGLITQAEQLKNASMLIGEGFLVAAEDAQQLARIFPELMKDAEVLSDGTIQLSSKTVAAVLGDKKLIVNGDTEATIDLIDNQIDQLEAAKAAAESRLILMKASKQSDVELSKEEKAELAREEKKLTDYLIDLGLDETQADNAVQAARSGNMQEYNTIVGQVSDDTATNLSGAMKYAADQTETNSNNMISSLDAIGLQSNAVARGLASMVNKVAGYVHSRAFGKGGKLTDDFESTNTTNTYEGNDNPYEDGEDETDDYPEETEKWISETELEIEDYEKSIAELTAFKSELLASLNDTNLATDGAISGAGGSPSKEDKSSKKDNGSSKEKEKWENTYDWLYNLTQDINEQLRIREKLEKKYDRLLQDTSKSASDLHKNLKDQLDILEKQKDMYQKMYDNRKKELQGVLEAGKDYSKYATYNWKDNTVEIDWTELNKVTDQDKGRAIENYISQLEEIESQMDDAEDSLDDIIDEIEELQNVGKDEYDDLENRVLDALIAREQEKIDKLSLIDESINDANNKLINSIQSNLDKIRQDRENEETEQSIEDNEKRLAYLQQDTSGANALEIQQLQEELATQKQDYTDTLIDQKLTAIQEQNDKASEERQYQIELAQAQLEETQKNGGFWNEAYRLIKDGTDATGKLVTNSTLTKLLKNGEAWDSMSNIQKMDWLSELETTVKAAMVYFSSERQLEKIGKKSGKITFTNANGEKLTGTVQKDGSVKVTTSKGTYTYKDVFQNYDGTYRTLETNPNFKANPSKSSGSSSKGSSSSGSSGSGKIKVGGLINAGKAQIYDYAGDKSGERQYFLNDPIYKVLDEQNGYLLTRWHKLNTGYTGWFKKSDVKAYAKGGLADFTGPAWLDGTKSKPELVLNARDTENFIQLKDILSNLLRGDTSSGNSGDNYFEIYIDVDSLNNDYDVEQLATKIKKMINDDARYRNVNSINLLR